MKNSILVDETLIGGNDLHNNSTIQDHSIFVDMPNNNGSGKNSARTGYHFYKNSHSNNTGQKPSGVRGGGFNYNNDESPQRIQQHVNNSNERLPNLTIKVNFSLNQCLEERRK